MNPCLLQRHYPPGKGRQSQCPPLQACIELLLRGMVSNGTKRTGQQWVEHGGLGTGGFAFFGLFPIRATRQGSPESRNVALGACVQFENGRRDRIGQRRGSFPTFAGGFVAHGVVLLLRASRAFPFVSFSPLRFAVVGTFVVCVALGTTVVGSGAVFFFWWILRCVRCVSHETTVYFLPSLS